VTSGLNAAHLGHINVHQDEIGLERIDQSQRLESIFGLAHQLKALGAAQHRARRQSKGRLIVHDDDGNGGVSHGFILTRPVPKRW
jgi:hypothetical protein